MNRTSWKNALVCSLSGITLFVSSMELLAMAPGGGNGGGNGGGGKGGGGGRGEGHSEGGRGNPGGGGGGGGGGGRFNPGGGGGGHGPGGNAGGGGGRAQQPGGGRPQPQPNFNHSPTFTRPNPGGQPGGRPSRPTPNPIGNAGRPIGGNAGVVQTQRPVLPNNAGAGAGTQHYGHNHSSIVNRPFGGNTVNWNNRSFNVGNNSYQPAYYRHSGYHGYWNGNRGYGSGSGLGISLGSNYGYGGGYNSGWGWGLGNGYGYGGGYGSNYGYRPFGWGLGGWGLGSQIYNSGYLGYSNPYYNSSYGSYGNYSYSQPIPVYYNSSQVVVSTDPTTADEVLNNADAAFQQNDFATALDITNKGLVQFPDDSVLHEFRALVLFARQDYGQAAATIHSVLAVGPGWDWTTLSSMYGDVTVYTEQLRTLEAFTKTNPLDAASQFLLSYHYLSCGHNDAAARHLKQVVKLMPNDRVASDMLKMISAPEAAIAGDPAQQPTRPTQAEPTRPAPQPVAPETLVGNWKAGRPDGSKFNLILTKDSQFTWSYAQKSQPAQDFGGTYTVEGNVLALERKDGGSLIAEVTPGGDAKFNFKLVGAPADDTGLDFSR